MPHRQHRNANSAPPQPKRKPAAKDDEWLVGVLVELDADAQRLVLRATQGRRPAFKEDEELAILVGDAVLKAADGDGDGKPGVRDLFPGDVLHIALVATAAGEPLRAARVTQTSRTGPTGGLRRVWEVPEP